MPENATHMEILGYRKNLKPMNGSIFFNFSLLLNGFSPGKVGKGLQVSGRKKSKHSQIKHPSAATK
jgi:hypothetical protein